MDSIVRPWKQLGDGTPTAGVGAVSLEQALTAVISQWIWDLAWLSCSSRGRARGLMFETKLTQPLPLTARQKKY